MFVLRRREGHIMKHDIWVQYHGQKLEIATHNISDWLAALHDNIHENADVPQWLREVSTIWQPYREHTTRLNGGQIIDMDALLPTAHHHAAFVTAVQQLDESIILGIRKHRHNRSGLQSEQGRYHAVLGHWLTMQQTTTLMQALLDETLHPVFSYCGEGITAAIMLSLLHSRRDGQLGYGIIKLPTVESIGGASFWIHPDNRRASIHQAQHTHHREVLGAPDILLHTVFSDEPNDAERYNISLNQGVKESWHLAFHLNQIWLYTAPHTSPLIFPATDAAFSEALNAYLDLSPVFELARTTFNWLLRMGDEI
jgi:hypothetical protein